MLDGLRVDSASFVSAMRRAKAAWDREGRALLRGPISARREVPRGVGSERARDAVFSRPCGMIGSWA